MPRKPSLPKNPSQRAKALLDAAVNRTENDPLLGRVALDAKSKLVGAWYIGDRDAEAAMFFMDNLAKRLTNRIQLTSDGHAPYLQAVEGAFGCDIDYAMLVKIYGKTEGKGPEKRYSPAQCLGARKQVVEGEPNKSKVSTGSGTV
jgi:hypothetical protein